MKRTLAFLLVAIMLSTFFDWALFANADNSFTLAFCRSQVAILNKQIDSLTLMYALGGTVPKGSAAERQLNDLKTNRDSWLQYINEHFDVSQENEPILAGQRIELDKDSILTFGNYISSDRDPRFDVFEMTNGETFYQWFCCKTLHGK